MIEIVLDDNMYGKAEAENVSSLVASLKKRGEVRLHPLEVAYILFVERENVIAVTSKGERLNFEEYLGKVLSRLDERCREESKGCVLSRLFWSMFTVYYDLRRRKRKVIPEVRREGTILEIRKEKWWAEYLVLEEGVKTTIDKLILWIEDVRANDMLPIVAIVDRNGGVTYYEVAKATLKSPRGTSTGEAPFSRVFS